MRRIVRQFGDMMLASAWLARRETRFWIVQAGVWSAYGLTLMLPWIGVYTIASMLPNKLAIAGTGFATSSALRLLYGSARDRRLPPDKMLLVAIGASVAGGLVWSGWSAAMLGADVTQTWRSLGALNGGAPHLGGPLYSALVLLAWSLAYLTLDRATVPVAAGAPTRTAVRVTEQAPTDGLITARDGDKTFVIASRELAWVQADGDYVRLHTDRKSLLIRTTMTQLESTLPAREYVRIHRSTIVNVTRISEVVPHSNAELFVVLRDGTRLKASRSYAERVRAALGVEARGQRR